MVKLSTSINLSQKQTLNTGIVNSLKILQLSSGELDQYLQTAIEENPFLEIEEEQEPDFEEPNEEYDSFVESYTRNSNNNESAENYYEQIPETKTLLQLILEQIHLHFSDNEDKKLAVQLFDHLDENGYFKGEIENDHAARILVKLKTFEPTGIFAENLPECLKIQLQEKHLLTPKFELLLAHLDLIAKKDFDKLRSLSKLSLEQLKEHIEIIKSLEPKPARNFNKTDNYNIKIDILVRYDKEKEEFAPELLTDYKYLKLNSDFSKISNTNDSWKAKCKEAKSLIKSISNRKDTILKIANSIVKYQQQFFKFGSQYLKPLSLKDIAKETEFHESTISRTINGKYLASERGTFELKYFFSSSIKSDTIRKEKSSTSIKDLIKDFITQETPDHILSDDDLATLLKTQKIEIARRTITKYREAMRIPSSAMRKRMKRG